jgi:predicted transcriptional regulator
MIKLYFFEKMEKKEIIYAIQQDTNSTLNPDWSLKKTIQVTKIPVEKEEEFFKTYILTVSYVLGLSGGEKDVFKSICANMSFHNRVILFKPTKKIIAEQTNLSNETVNNLITSLTRRGLLIREARSVYIVNPNYASRGSWEDIKALRLEIEFASHAREIKV